MKTQRPSFAFLATALLLPGGLVPQDWPQWRGPNRDGKTSGFAVPEKWPTALKERWTTKVGEGDATPALAGDKLYVFARQGGDEVALCLNAKDGKVVWQEGYQTQAVSGPANKHGGPRSSPTVAEGKVITLGVRSVLSCLDAGTGKVLWRKDEIKGWPDFFAAMSPLVADGLCVAHLGGKENGAVVAYELAGGAEKWRWMGDGPTYSSPFLMTVEGTKTVMVQADRNLVGLSLADGKLLWKVATEPQRRAFASTPIVDGSLVIFMGGGRGTAAIRIEKAGDGLAAKQVWENEDLLVVFNNPVLHEGLLFGATDQGKIFCMKAESGEVGWIDTERRGMFCATVDAGEAIVSLFDGGTLVAFEPSGKGYEELVRIQVAAGGTFAHPILAGKRVIVKHAEAVTLFTLE